MARGIAKYNGVCKVCGKPITAGVDLINWAPRSGKGAWHAVCKTTESVEEDDQSELAPPSSSAAPDLSALIAAAVAEAIAKMNGSAPVPSKPKPIAKKKAALTMTRPWDVATELVNSGDHILAWGPPGTGKSYLAHGVDETVYVVTCHEQMQVSELIGHVWPNGDKWEWRDGPGTLAFRNGNRLVLNELGRCNPEVLDCLLSLCDSRESAKITLPTGETLRNPHPKFVCIGTSNQNPEEGLDPALQERFIFIHLKKPHPALIARIAAKFPKLAEMVDKSFESGDKPLPTRRALWFIANHETYGMEVAAQLAFGAVKGRDIANMLNVPVPATAVEAKGATA